MTRTLRPFAHSRGLQLAALLAWLFLAITPAFAMPAGMMAGMHHHRDATPTMHRVGHGDHATSVGSDRSCCGADDGGSSGHACGCAAVCGTVALLPVTGELAPVRFANVPWTQFSSTVPGSSSTPPLRPPTA